MRKYISFMLFAVFALVSLSVFAEDVGVKLNIEPEYKMIAGLVTMDESPDALELTNDFMTADIKLDSAMILVKRKPDKEFTLTHTVMKPTKLAAMQNSNFDRVSI